MLIERSCNQIIITLPSTINADDIQDILDFARYKELTSGFSINAEKVDKIASQINSNWWSKNRKKMMQ